MWRMTMKPVMAVQIRKYFYSSQLQRVEPLFFFLLEFTNAFSIDQEKKSVKVGHPSHSINRRSNYYSATSEIWLDALPREASTR